MKNLEKQIYDKLKHVLLKHDLDIVSNSDIFKTWAPDMVIFLTYAKVNKSCNTSWICFWTSIYDMLFGKDNIFSFVPDYVCPSINYIRYCAGDSLEEIAIKMDLMGV